MHVDTCVIVCFIVYMLSVCVQLHKGHKFVPQQFQVPTVCEQCSKSIALLETGDVCQGKIMILHFPLSLPYDLATIAIMPSPLPSSFCMC